MNKMSKKRMNPALAAMTQARKEMLLTNAAGKANLLLSLMVLHDKFGYWQKRLERFLIEYQKQLEAYNSGHIEKATDFEDVLKEECGIEVCIGKGASIYKIDR